MKYLSDKEYHKIWISEFVIELVLLITCETLSNSDNFMAGHF